MAPQDRTASIRTGAPIQAGAREASPKRQEAAALPDISITEIVPATEGHTIVVPPFRLRRGLQTYALSETLRIDVREVEPDIYRVYAVHDFWIDDENPDLSECVAGIFLGRRRASGVWEEPETWPTECRSLAILGTVDTSRRPYLFTPDHGG